MKHDVRIAFTLPLEEKNVVNAEVRQKTYILAKRRRLFRMKK